MNLNLLVYNNKVILTTIYLKTRWQLYRILQLAGLEKVSNMESILCGQKYQLVKHCVTEG